MREIKEAASLVQEQAHEDANIIFGASIDEMRDAIKVTVIATGFGRAIVVRGARGKAACGPPPLVRPQRVRNPSRSIRQRAPARERVSMPAERPSRRDRSRCRRPRPRRERERGERFSFNPNDAELDIPAFLRHRGEYRPRHSAMAIARAGFILPQNTRWPSGRPSAVTQRGQRTRHDTTTTTTTIMITATTTTTTTTTSTTTRRTGTDHDLRGVPESRIRIALAADRHAHGCRVRGGLYSRSVALVSDAGHMLADVGTLTLALIAQRFASRSATPR